MAHDVFISYAADEDGEAALAVVGALEEQGLRCWMAPRDILPGTEYSAAVAEAIPASRAFVLLLSTGANASGFVHREVERAVSRGKPVLTVRLEDVPPASKLELFVSSSQWFDAFARPLASQLPELARKVERLVERQGEREGTEQAAPGLRVALLYKRQAQPDERLLQLLEAQLVDAGHRVFIDRHMGIGVEWARQIEQEIRSADAVVVLLSPAAVSSEMLAYEVEVAHQAAQQNAGKPRLLPVRIAFESPLPPELAPKLEPLHYFLWHGPEDDGRLAGEILAALERPSRPLTRSGRLEMVGGAVPLDARFYVERPTDQEFHTAIRRGDAIVLVKGARQMGKTSLLARGLRTARETELSVVLTDFQKLTADQLETLEGFYLALGEMLADQLDLDVLPEDSWRQRRSPNTNFERFLDREVLRRVEGQLLWAMDEVDRLFSRPFGGEVFALFRTWHNERALNPGGPWSRLTLAIAYATEAHLFITDLNQSPFNVGTLVSLEDFTLDQVADLNRRHGSPLRDGAELRRFSQLLGGQPYLVRLGLNELVQHRSSIAEFAARADQDDGPFGSHLRRVLVLAARDPRLCEALRAVLRGEPCPDHDAFYRLRSAGVLAGHAKEEARPRCGIYATYLARQLL